MARMPIAYRTDSQGAGTLSKWTAHQLAVLICIVCLSGMAKGDEPTSQHSTDEDSAAPQWRRALDESFPPNAERYEIRRIDLLVWLIGSRFTDVLLSLDQELASTFDGLGSYATEKKRQTVLRTHPGIKALQQLKARLSVSELLLPRTHDREETDLEYVNGNFVLWSRTDDSGLTADRLELGVVEEVDDDRYDRGETIGLTVGKWNRFKCWYEPGEARGEVYRRCGVVLKGLPQSLKDRIEKDFGKTIHARLCWRGLPHGATARSWIWRGGGNRTRSVLVVDHPAIELLDSDGGVLWRAE